MSDKADAIADSAVMRLVGRVFMGLVALILGWAVSLLIDLDKRGALLQQQIFTLVQKMDILAVQTDKRITERTASRYTSEEASKDWALQKGIDDLQSFSLKSLEERIGQIEQDIDTYRYGGGPTWSPSKSDPQKGEDDLP